MPLAACSVLQVTCTASASHLSHAVCMLSPNCLLAMHLPISNSPQTNQTNVRPWPTSTKLPPSLMYMAVWMVHKFQFYHQQSMKTSMSAEKDSIHSTLRNFEYNGGRHSPPWPTFQLCVGLSLRLRALLIALPTLVVS